jgi:hypothetical protein
MIKLFKMKKILLTVCGLFVLLTVRAQEPRVDTLAVMIIDRMASVIGDLNSCSFILTTATDIKDPDYGLIKQNEVSDVYLEGPDKMHVSFLGDKGHHGFWYNGQLIVAYSFDENNYTVIETPGNIIDMIDMINKEYAIEVPAADFFYPTFTDDILAFFDDVIFMGKRKLNGKDCWLILASNKEISAQIWFAADSFTLPQKFVIVYKNDGNRQYEATFSNWQLNPEFPPSIFEFLPPPGARQVSILPRTK